MYAGMQARNERKEKGEIAIQNTKKNRSELISTHKRSPALYVLKENVRKKSESTSVCSQYAVTVVWNRAFYFPPFFLSLSLFKDGNFLFSFAGKKQKCIDVIGARHDLVGRLSAPSRFLAL